MGEQADIAIVGAGLAGATLALALARAPGVDPALRLLDASPEARPSDDIRAYAIAAGTRRMLGELGIWGRVADHAAPVTGMDITDTRAAEVVRPVLLSFETEARPGEPVLHFVEARRLADATAAALGEAGIPVRRGARLEAVSVDGAGARLATRAGEVSASLAVGADGARSALRRLSGISEVKWGYGQTAIVAILTSSVPHKARAVQHFLPGGPLALLPLPDDRRGLVWTVPAQEAERLLALDPPAFAAALMRGAGPEAGDLEVVEGPRSHPLELAIARRFVAPRIALVGDAAHRVHPLAGQGLNLGYRDIAALAETIVDALRRGEDIGSLAVLERYERWRRFDTVEFAATMDVLNRLFATDLAPVRALRDFGLAVVDRLPPLKRRFVGEAAGTAGRLPRLMEGEPV